MLPRRAAWAIGSNRSLRPAVGHAFAPMAHSMAHGERANRMVKPYAA
jgi:hypothetical protein